MGWDDFVTFWNPEYAEQKRLKAPPSSWLRAEAKKRGYEPQTTEQALRILRFVEPPPAPEPPKTITIGNKVIRITPGKPVEEIYTAPKEAPPEVPLFNRVTGVASLYPETEAKRLKVTMPNIYETYEERVPKKPPDIFGAPYQGPGGSLLQKSERTGKVVSVLGREAEARERVPERVKQAQSLVLRLSQSIDPVVALLLQDNPEMATHPGVKSKIEGKVPSELEGAYQREIAILDEYYGVPKTPKGSLYGGGVTHEFIPGKGLVPVR